MIRPAMPTERQRRQIESLLDEIEAASTRGEWDVVLQRVDVILALDPENEDALAYRAAASRADAPALSVRGAAVPASTTGTPESFGGGRYHVRRFLGEGGKKKVYLAHDELLDRDVAFALIKSDGLDAAARARITREAQAMGRLGS